MRQSYELQAGIDKSRGRQGRAACHGCRQGDERLRGYPENMHGGRRKNHVARGGLLLQQGMQGPPGT